MKLKRTRLAAPALALALALLAVTDAAGSSRASLTDVQDEVMCVVCHTPLAVSESPQANAERAFIRSLIATGATKAQIKRALVAEYGPAVLALPRPRGFNLTVYILPPALVLGGVVALAITLPRWRRRTRLMAPGATRAGPPLEPSDLRRLEDDLARYD